MTTLNELKRTEQYNELVRITTACGIAPKNVLRPLDEILAADKAVAARRESMISDERLAALNGAPDPVNHPSHYTTGGIECFDAMRAMLTDEEMIGYLRGNSFKYRWRFRHKAGAQDLRKAEWYEHKLLEIIDKTA